jgi:hypothetical protein
MGSYFGEYVILFSFNISVKLTFVSYFTQHFMALNGKTTVNDELEGT